MISRRTIRIKVMQTLYALEQERLSMQANEETTKADQLPPDPVELLKQLNDKFDVVVEEIEKSKSEKSVRLVKGQ